MAIFHIKANDASSVDQAFGDAFNQSGPGTLIVDPNAFLISEFGPDGTSGAHLSGSWIGTINGTVGDFESSIGGTGISVEGSSSDVSTITIGGTGEVFGPDHGIFVSVEAATITNRGTISSIYAILVVNAAGQTHITNAGTLVGVVKLGSTDDVFNDFQKVGKVIKNGTVVGRIDLGDGADHFNGGANTETVRDGSGADSYKFGGGNDTYFAVGGGGSTGADVVDGGAGRDTYDATGATFTVLVNLDTKIHGVLAAQFAQGSDVGDPGNTDKVIGFENATGGSAADLLVGSNGTNTLAGGAGTDDLVGLGGRDVLTGGADADRFLFQKLSDSGVTASTRDLITDFNQGIDHINLVDLEASVGHGLTFLGNHHFHHAVGELRESYGGGNTIVSGDSNGDGKADFSIALQGHFALTSGDFTL